MKIENISTLKINRLTQEQYEKAKAEDKLSDSELYFTPASPTGGDIDVTEYAYSKTETYSRVEVDAKIPSLDGYAKTSDLSGKQDKLTFDGTYNASTNKAATVQTVIDKVAEIVANAPEDFNTLKELSDWLTSHEGSAATMNSAIQENAADIKAMKEEIVSDKKEFHIVDDNYNIVATIDENGLHTVKVIADKVFSEGSKCINEERLRELNYVSATDVIEYVGNEVTKLTNGTTVVGKASTANSLTEGYVEYTASDGKITLTTPINKAVLICARGENVNSALEAMVVLTGYSTPSHSGYYCVRSAAPSSLNVVTFYDSKGATFTPYTVRVREL